MKRQAFNDELYQRASYLMSKERWAQAAKLLQPECAQTKRDWRSSWNLGWCYFKMGKLEFARKCLIRANSVLAKQCGLQVGLGHDLP